MSASDALDVVLTNLTDALPDVDWSQGRLMPAMVHKTKTLGAISINNEVLAPSGEYLSYQLQVQCYLPVFVENQDNLKLETIGRTSPKDIMDVCDEIRTALVTLAAGDGAKYASMREIRVDYPDDPMGQQTRLEMLVNIDDFPKSAYWP